MFELVEDHPDGAVVVVDEPVEDVGRASALVAPGGEPAAVAAETGVGPRVAGERPAAPLAETPIPAAA